MRKLLNALTCYGFRVGISSACDVKRFSLSAIMSGGDGINLNALVSALDRFADPKLAEGWDNVGLLIQPSSHLTVTKVMLTNDLTAPVMEEAVSNGINLIISYHPPIFAPLKRITQNSWKEKIVAQCLENRIALYSPHTAWDAVKGGVGDNLASAFGEYSESVNPLVVNQDSHQMYEVITGNNNIRDLYPQAQVKFSLKGEDPGSMMYRLVANKKDAESIANLPDTIVTKVEQVYQRRKGELGMGRLVVLKDGGCSLSTCLELMKRHTGLTHLRLARAISHTTESVVKRVALVPGSGGTLLRGAVADLYVTGEMLHHDLLDANHRNVSVILTNHSDSERPFLPHFKQHLLSLFPQISVHISAQDRDPVETV